MSRSNSAFDSIVTEKQLKLKENLRKLCAIKGIRPAEVSRKLNIPRATLHNWECGVTPRDIETLKRVADFFSVSIDELCFGPCEIEATSVKLMGLSKSQNFDKPMKFEVVVRKI